MIYIDSDVLVLKTPPKTWPSNDKAKSCGLTGRSSMHSWVTWGCNRQCWQHDFQLWRIVGRWGSWGMNPDAMEAGKANRGIEELWWVIYKWEVEPYGRDSDEFTNDTFSKVALSCSQISQLDGSWGTKSPAISDVPWFHPWPISEAPWPQSSWPHHASPLNQYYQYYSNTTASLQQYTLRYRTYNFHAWTSFHQLPPISTRKQLPRPLWEDCNQLQVLQTAFGCSQDLRFSRLEFLEKSLQFKT